MTIRHCTSQHSISKVSRSALPFPPLVQFECGLCCWKRRKGKHTKFTEWDWWSRFDHHEPYGKCAVLKMTSNDPKMIYLLYFWTFWLLFVCLRPTTLCVVTSTILTLTPFAISRSIHSWRSLDFTKKIQIRLLVSFSLMDTTVFLLQFLRFPGKDSIHCLWTKLKIDSFSRAPRIASLYPHVSSKSKARVISFIRIPGIPELSNYQSEINTQTQKMARARDMKCPTLNVLHFSSK